MKVFLVGQPNTGKSTIFNHVAGFKAVVGNFPGVTVEGEKSIIKIKGKTIELWDLPGLYSLLPSDKAEEATVKILNEIDADIIINVIDASALERNIELTIELLPVNKPMIIALTMNDVAIKKGIKINIKKLEKQLGIPVVIVNGRTGEGVKELFELIIKGKAQKPSFSFPEHINKYIKQIMQVDSSINIFAAQQALRGDFSLIPNKYKKQVEDIYSESMKTMRMEGHGDLLAPYRHHLSMSIFESIADIEHVKNRRFTADDLFMHPLWGYFAMILILMGTYFVVMKSGAPVEGIFVSVQGIMEKWLLKFFNINSFSYVLVRSVLQGLFGSLMVVFPYLFPFLFILSVLEDVGYLPRAAYMMDGFMHKIGLHGRSIIPMILGYGCSVPAVMATRILPNRKERILTAILAIMIPCSARTTIIMGLVSYLIGVKAGFAIYIINIIIIIISAKILGRYLKSDTGTFVLEIPEYRMFSLKIVLLKTWIRIKDFFYLVIPVMIIGSMMFGIIEFFNWSTFLDMLFRPITFLLGLPPDSGTLLIFGILRKEMSLIMLFSKFGSANNILNVFGTKGIFIFTLFSIFYIPCIATIVAIWKEFGSKVSLLMILFTFIIALVTGMLFNGVWTIIY